MATWSFLLQDIPHSRLWPQNHIEKQQFVDGKYLGILESLDPGPGLWTRKCWTLDRDLWKSNFVCFWAEILVQSPAFQSPKSRPRVQRFQNAKYIMGHLSSCAAPLCCGRIVQYSTYSMILQPKPSTFPLSHYNFRAHTPEFNLKIISIQKPTFIQNFIDIRWSICILIT